MVRKHGNQTPPILQVIYNRYMGKRRGGKLLLEFDIGSFYFYSTTYRSRRQRTVE